MSNTIKKSEEGALAPMPPTLDLPLLPVEILATCTHFPVEHSAANNSACIELMINQHNCNNY